MTKDRKRRKKKKGRSSGGGGGQTQSRGGGGLMQGMVRGFRRAAGVEKTEKGKPSLLNNILWILVIAALAGFVISRYTR